ncbi:MAG: DUF3800 domain-containing protein [Dissulfurimicrobium hydrothermale]|uniref:DUF3800 domain-containing protein n=1 Tax=Dissulfurimicrobium hydrothermale TaxID=1750598 RepID=UPI003C74179E
MLGEVMSMYLLYTDEVNINPASTEFFIYGGVAVHSNQAASLSAEVDRLRGEYGYQPNDPLKFNTKERPAGISPDAHKEIKRQVIETAVKHGVRLFTSFILHKIATSPDEARRKEINRVCYNFDVFLKQENEFGLVLIDTFSDEKLPEILREKFAIGLRGFPFSRIYRLERVLGFHLATIGSSNFSSVVDIVLGSLRYAVNSRVKPDRHVVACTLLQQIAPMYIPGNKPGDISELSVFFSPKTVKVVNYQKQYCELSRYLKKCGFGHATAPDQCGDYDG